MKSRDLIFIIIVLAVIGGLYYLSTKNKAKPMSPIPPEHVTAKTREECFTCHLPETFAELERRRKHPGKWRDARVSCLLCHTAPQSSSLKSQISNLESSNLIGNHLWLQPKRN
jgi:hypothetical protein